MNVARWWLRVLRLSRLLWPESGEWHRLGAKRRTKEREELYRDEGGEG